MIALQGTMIALQSTMIALQGTMIALQGTMFVLQGTMIAYTYIVNNDDFYSSIAHIQSNTMRFAI